jgi:hypothetical protein
MAFIAEGIESYSAAQPANEPDRNAAGFSIKTWVSWNGKQKMGVQHFFQHFPAL